MVDPKKVKKVVLSSALAGVIMTTPMTGYAAFGDQLLKQGMRHQDVKELQEVLRSKGYFTYNTSTGYFGSITKDAVMRFQRDANLSVDGIVGPKTFQALNTASTTTKAKASQAKPTAETHPLLRMGSRGQAVTDLQNKLAAEGLYTYKIDGIYGSRTAKAVRQYQQKYGLQVDGIVGPKTWDRLNDSVKRESSKQANPVPKNNSSNPSVIKFGSRGATVTELQNLLKASGVFPYAVDGIFGSQTLAAVKRFQLQQGLTVDGIVGSQTWAKLRSPDKPPTPGNGKNSSKSEKNSSFNVMQLIADAGALRGSPYVWGGTTPSGFDCSGFLVYVFKKQGVNIPRTVAQQWNFGKSVSKPSVGDIVFFETYKSGPSHNGIYVGNNQFIHSGTSTGVTISNLNSNYWKTRYLGAKRLH